MVIVSQNKDFIVNFKNIHSIGVDKVNGAYNINFVVGSGDDTLGEYATEERAKQVLQEMLKVYKQQTDKYHFTEVNNIYEMPEV